MISVPSDTSHGFITGQAAAKDRYRASQAMGGKRKRGKEEEGQSFEALTG